MAAFAVKLPIHIRMFTGFRKQLVAFHMIVLVLALLQAQGHSLSAEIDGVAFHSFHGSKAWQGGSESWKVRRALRPGGLQDLGSETKDFGRGELTSRNDGQIAIASKTREGRRNLRNQLLEVNAIMTSDQEMEALLAFKAAVTNDSLSVLTSWHKNDSSPCRWTGITCASNQEGRHVIGLDLELCELEGNFSSAMRALGRLHFLQRLHVPFNHFSGTIPGASLTNFSSLYYFNISDNAIGGAIPAELGELVSLETLDLGDNDLTGNIPASIGNCSLLKLMYFSSDLLEGSIPQTIGMLSNLEHFSIATFVPRGQDAFISALRNSLSGSIPPEVGNCSSLISLNFQYNPQLGGKLPVELSQLKNLQYFIAGWCAFEGVLPTWLMNLTSLSQLDFTQNRLHGDIPDELGKIQNLTAVHLGGNNLTGGIPNPITNRTSLTELAIQSNLLSGQIPPQLGLLTSLELLYLGNNRFTGVYPSTLSNCSMLRHLAVGENRLMDPQIMPTWIVSLVHLVRLFLYDNNFYGEIPKEIGRLSNLVSLLLYENNLTGEIPSSLGNCSSLAICQIDSNQLTGSVPPDLGKLGQLFSFVISANLLTGSISSFITNLTSMMDLEVNTNNLEGTIDGTWGNMLSLEYLDMSDNYFVGPIPKTLTNCSSLIYLDLSKNRVSGEIPPSFGNLTLQNLYLGYNKIGGKIPADLGKSYSLAILGLQNNALEEQVPSNVGALFNLQELYLAKNKLSGAVPTSLSNCSNLQILDLSHNQFTGDIPRVGPYKQTLRYLNLSHNLFSDSWPAAGLNGLESIQFIDVSVNNIWGSILAAGNWRDLRSLDISLNNLSGSIPEWLGALRYLSFFNASYNNFQGPLPVLGVFKSNLSERSFLGNPGLCGDILGPGRNCLSSQNGTQGRSSSCSGFTCKRAWIPTTLGVLVIISIATLGAVYSVHRMRVNNRNQNYMIDVGSYVRISSADISRIIDSGGENIIGVGANSVVYKGVLPDGQMFAVKTLRTQEGEDCEADLNKGGQHAQGRNKYTIVPQEVLILAKLRHRNIVKVLNFHSGLNVIILEYMSEGSLHNHLHPRGGTACELSWERRFNIASDVAQGMKYVHHDLPDPLIHGDLKPNNVLLDTNFEAKITDFGLSKFVNPRREGEASVSTVCGTIGYMPPEYAFETHVSTKGDVYSYGVLLLELLTGRQPTMSTCSEPELSYRDSALELFQKAPRDLLDPILRHEAAIEPVKSGQMMFTLQIGFFCTRQNPQGRPSMSDVLAMLEQTTMLGRDPVRQRTLQDLAADINAGTDDIPSIDVANFSFPSL